ncbi:MAG: TIGR02302 family protein [Pikeienuella sp.]
MADPIDRPHGGVAKAAPRRSPATAQALAQSSVERQARRARWALFVERALAALWPVWAVLALFLGLALLGVPAMLPAAWHGALLAAFAAVGLFLLGRGLWSLRFPGRDEGLARLDRGAAGRPAQTYRDALASGSGDRGTEALWRAHKRMLAGRAAALRAKAPDTRVSSRDPFALRHGGLIALAAGLVALFSAEDGAGVRLAEQINPGAQTAGPAVAAPTLEAWATPPAHTGETAIYLTRLKDGAPVRLPVGTEISLRVFDISAPPVLEQDVGAEAVFVDKGAGVHDAVFTVAHDGRIRVSGDGSEMGVWPIVAIPDAPPAISFDGDPKTGERGALELSYRASDDYGVRAADLRITLDPGAAGPTPDSAYEPIELDLPLPLVGANREVEETLIEDLAAHPWAGLPVIYRIRARDAAGQEGVAEISAPLPARPFHHPMAKALVEQRRALALSTKAAPRVLDVLEAVMTYPEHIFDDDTAYLIARIAVRRLGYALEEGRLDAEVKSVVDLLWKAALRLEDGDLSSAAERLARAQRNLRDAIENGASEEELARLMEELRQAMRDYMAEMMQEALRDQASGRQQQQQGEAQTLTMDDIEKMLQELEEAIRNGQEELARQMLQALQQMMQNLQMAQPGQGQPGQGDQMMNQLGDMIGEQQGLADRSFDQMRRGQGQRPGEGQGEGQGQHRNQGQGEGRGSGAGRGGAPGGDSAGNIARDQEALRKLLNDLRRNLPGAVGEEARRSLDEAERAMEDAVGALERGDERQAVDDQVRALDQLREGRRQMGSDMAESQGLGDGDRAGRDGRGRDADQEDPLGRPREAAGPLDGDSVRVPGEALGKRARELQDEIRRRAGERARPAEELDYLDRLLERF